MLSAQDPKRKRKKLLFKLKMSVKRCEEERTILLFKGHPLNRHLLAKM